MEVYIAIYRWFDANQINEKTVVCSSLSLANAFLGLQERRDNDHRELRILTVIEKGSDLP